MEPRGGFRCVARSVGVPAALLVVRRREGPEDGSPIEAGRLDGFLDVLHRSGGYETVSMIRFERRTLEDVVKKNARQRDVARTWLLVKETALASA